MAITVDWSTRPWLITIPQADCTLVSGTRYEITVDELWALLRDFSDGPEGSARQTTYRRIPSTSSTPPITEIDEAFYRAQFENGLWSVDIVDGNTNFRDVEVKNMVSVGTNNTTGFSIVSVGSGLSADQETQLLEIYTRLGLNIADPITDTTGSIDSDSGDIEITRTGDGETTSTLTRQ